MIEKEITHEHYKEALLERKQFMHKMKILRSEGHEMYGMCMNKISISPFDTKCWIADDGIQTRAYGHITSSFGPALKFARLIQISHIDERRKFFFVQCNGPGMLC